MILAIETSTTHASLALAEKDSGVIIDHRDFVTDRAHNTAIFASLDSLLEGRREQISEIAVGIGPGNYSGIRVGIAVANGLNLVLGSTLAGGSSLEAWECDSDSYVVIGDARRKSFFIAEVVDRVLVSAPQLVGSDEIDSSLKAFRDRGLEILTPDASVVSAIADARLSYPHARQLAGVAAKWPLERWSDSAPLEPHYLRAPYITTPKKKVSR
ncbi:MAG: tRNA (adenosine(37)-N6)-threonylcarbamoyltransferase complex dimerization subunit type 1 TsaB [Verrucomicrobiales bacterium]|nr:tRNA (adenosine(37)-N6)-threonylcarbamoyltransferase complex dimerization subunit type 1 TsaB [Verrucomicrobiales bacterium]